MLLLWLWCCPDPLSAQKFWWKRQQTKNKSEAEAKTGTGAYAGVEGGRTKQKTYKAKKGNSQPDQQESPAPPRRPCGLQRTAPCPRRSRRCPPRGASPPPLQSWPAEEQDVLPHGEQCRRAAATAGWNTAAWRHLWSALAMHDAFCCTTQGRSWRRLGGRTGKGVYP